MKRLLAVSWEMPPMYGPRATQVSRTLGELSASGWQSSVVCLAPRKGGPHWRDGVAAAPLDGVDVVRVPSPEEWFPVRAAGRLAPLLRRFPDPERVWVAGAVRAATERVAAHGDYSGLITFGQPWSNHLVGLRTHRRTSLPWVAHFSDPWVDSPYAVAPGWVRRIWQRMEADVVREATALVFVTAETADLVMRKYPAAWRDKAAIVPHGFAPSTGAVDGSRRPGPMRIVHAGRFYSGIRTPLGVLRALAELNAREPLAGTLELTLVGPHADEYKRDVIALGVDGIVRFRGRVSPDEATAITADADVLLVIDAPSAGPSVFLPSKLVDYLPFRKPILGVTPEPGASASLLRRLGCAVADPEQIDSIASAIADLVRRWRADDLAVSPSFGRVAGEYDIARTTARLNGVLIRAFDQ